MDEMEEMREEFEEFLGVAQANPDCLNAEVFTFQSYLKAHHHVSTRCFGYAVPELSLVPFADMVNHHTTDNYYEVFNLRVATKMAKDEHLVTAKEKYYLTKERSKVDFVAHLPDRIK